MRADACEMNNSGDIEFIAAWVAIKDSNFQAPEGLCQKWLTNLPAGLRVPMLDVIDLLAFGAAMKPDGRTKVDAWGRRILAARELFRGAASGAIYGQRAELLNNGALSALPLKCLGLYSRIAAQEFANDALILSPFNPKWLSPTSIASDLAFWGQREAVSYIDVTIDKDSLGAWIGKLSGKEARRRKRGQIKVKEIAADLWPGGQPPKGLPVGQRNGMIRAEAKKRYGTETLDAKTIDKAFVRTGNNEFPPHSA
jgi:hypothetical protein